MNIHIRTGRFGFGIVLTFGDFEQNEISPFNNKTFIAP